MAELVDGSPAAVTWVQWLGGDSGDYVYALAVNGDEIYAAGGSSLSDSWETLGSTAGTFNISASESFVLEITDGSPPTLAWLQWLGGSSSDVIYALAINGDEVYAGGFSVSFTSWETVGATAGTHNTSSSEGWIVEIADGSPPTLAWLQWLGGSSSDIVYAIVVNGDEIYAGGYSNSYTSWETVGAVAGTYNASASEGWVVEIADGTPPTLAWLQWLGGAGFDYVYALAVNGEEVYAGGQTGFVTSWETAGIIAGTYNAPSSEGYVVEIVDSSPSTIAWLQWLGGDHIDIVYALAVNGDEVYAGGYSQSFTSWETVDVTAGTYNASNYEAWVVEIADGSPPTVAWQQWLGGDGSDTVYALAVNANEIYAGGILDGNISFEVTLPDNYFRQVGLYVEITDNAANTGANAIFFGSSF